MSRPEPSNWRRPPTELLEEFTNDDAWVNALIDKHLPNCPAARRDKVREKLGEIVELLFTMLRFQDRPTGGSMVAGLRKVRDAAEALRGALDSLDTDSRSLLGRQAPMSNSDLLDDLMAPGDRFQVAVESVAAMVEWATSALEPIKNSNAGRIGSPEGKVAISCLQPLMMTGLLLGSAPTGRAVEAFANDLLAPIREKIEAYQAQFEK